MANKRGRIDYWLFLIVFILVCIGLVMVLSSSQYVAAYDKGDSYYYLKRQLINGALAVCIRSFSGRVLC